MRGLGVALVALVVAAAIGFPVGQIAGALLILTVSILGLSVMLGAQKLTERLVGIAAVLAILAGAWGAIVGAVRSSTQGASASGSAGSVAGSVGSTLATVVVVLGVLLGLAAALLIAARIRAALPARPHPERAHGRRRAEVVEPERDDRDPWATRTRPADDELHLFRRNNRGQRR